MYRTQGITVEKDTSPVGECSSVWCDNLSQTVAAKNVLEQNQEIIIFFKKIDRQAVT